MKFSKIVREKVVNFCMHLQLCEKRIKIVCLFMILGAPDSISLSFYHPLLITISLSTESIHPFLSKLECERVRAHYERQRFPQWGIKCSKRMGDEVKSKKRDWELRRVWEQMKVWYFQYFGIQCLRGGGKNTLYHCVWCFASVSLSCTARASRDFG